MPNGRARCWGLWGQRHPGRIRVRSHPEIKSIPYIYISPTPMKGGPTLTMPPTWKPQLRGYTIGWGLGYVQPTSPKEDTVPSRDNKTLFHIYVRYSSGEPGTKSATPRGDTAPHGVEASTPCTAVAGGWGSQSQLHLGRLQHHHPQNVNASIYLQLQRY